MSSNVHLSDEIMMMKSNNVRYKHLQPNQSPWRKKKVASAGTLRGEMRKVSKTKQRAFSFILVSCVTKIEQLKKVIMHGCDAIVFWVLMNCY